METATQRIVTSRSPRRRRGMRNARRILRRIVRMNALARQRRDLGRLPDHLLEDIGVTRHGARTEGSRSIWDAPDHWRF